MDLAELESRLETLRKLNDGLTEDELKMVYLDRLSDGELPEQAARELGKTSSWFRRRRSEKSIHYDPDFEERYEQIMHPDGEHSASVRDRTRQWLFEAAKGGNVRAIEKILMAYDPDFAFLRPAIAHGDLNIDKLMIVMKDVPTPILQQVRAALEEKKRELPDIEQ